MSSSDPAAAHATGPATSAATDPVTVERPARRLGADWIAVIVAAVLVLLAATGLLPSIPFLVK
ncbi:hypothetical protein ACFQH9_19650 [Pseudonocardia lutea]|uniref:Uncharacterized protein n=1 Tax=Pseudonocardia lutea TaxID=2172015 RepID=A0ABW1IBY0_9PSEU|nr:hypothetical protein [Pseudonocardia kujensis]MCE0762423.1 hypothetical protein [Pseudonocardia kujensis]